MQTRSNFQRASKYTSQTFISTYIEKKLHLNNFTKFEELEDYLHGPALVTDQHEQVPAFLASLAALHHMSLQARRLNNQPCSFSLFYTKIP